MPSARRRRIATSVVSIEFEILNLEKRVPLTISRGTQTHSEVLWLRWCEEGVEGWGEAVPWSIGTGGETLQDIVNGVQKFKVIVEQGAASDAAAVLRDLRSVGASSAVLAAFSQALLDWRGKKSGQSVAGLLAFPPAQPQVTSVTVGLATPEKGRERVRRWRELGEIRAFKIKLGSPAGIRSDREFFSAVKDEAGPSVRLSVDANGGWSVADAGTMARWLYEQGIDHLEQPLSRGNEAGLAEVRRASPLPIVCDESCVAAADVPRLAPFAHGVNIKLMKCGGIENALELIAAARAHGLKVLLGCYGSSALGNTCAAALAPLADYLDLDSHLNLKHDPFGGATLRDGKLDVPEAPGFGVSHE